MDIQSPHHLDRLRDQPELKIALLRSGARPGQEARFERHSKNAMYLPPVERLVSRFLTSGRVEDVREDCEIYGRPCWLVCTLLAPSPHAPYAIAVAAADGAPFEALVELLQRVSRDYWYGSYFFK